MARLVRALVLCALLSLAAAANPAPYYISTEVVLFDSGSSDICGTSGGASETFTTAALGSSYYMGLYKAYTDDTFTQEVERTAEEAHLGILGECDGRHVESCLPLYLYRLGLLHGAIGSHALQPLPSPTP